MAHAFAAGAEPLGRSIYERTAIYPGRAAIMPLDATNRDGSSGRRVAGDNLLRRCVNQTALKAGDAATVRSGLAGWSASFSPENSGSASVGC